MPNQITIATPLAINGSELGTLKCPLRRDADAVIEVPKGTELRVEYASGAGPNVVTIPKDVLGAGSPEVTGKVLSGSDWILARRDGVILIDTRATIALEFTLVSGVKHKALMDMTFKGTIDLKRTFGAAAATGEDAYLLYKRGTQNPILADAAGNPCHHILGSLRFEGGEGPTSADYADHFTNASKAFDTLKPLVRQQYIAVGIVEIQKTPHYDPVRIELSVLGF